MIPTSYQPWNRRRRDPYLVDVTWEPRKIEASIHYLDWLMNGKQSGPFDPRTCGP